MKTTEARFNGKCECGAKVFTGDRVRFNNRKIVNCEACRDFGPVILGDDGALGWMWGICLGRNVSIARKLYRAIRKAYMALPPAPKGTTTFASFVRTSKDGESIRGVQGRVVDTESDFDAMISAQAAQEAKDWAGTEEFLRLTIAQHFTLRAAQAYESAACGVAIIPPTKETLDQGGFLGGERLNFAEDSHPAIDAMVREAFGISA